MGYRRRLHRMPVGWKARCLSEGASQWRDCQVVDISILGLGLTMRHSRPNDLLGRRMTVEVPAVSDSVAFRLGGVVRNTVVLRGVVVRVGVEFSGLRPAELAIAQALGSLTEDPDSESVVSKGAVP